MNPQYHLHPTPRTSHPHHPCWGPLLPVSLVVVDVVVVIIIHCHHRPPLPPLSPSWGWLLFVAWCRLSPMSSSPLSSTIAENPPTTSSPPHRLVLSPPAIPPPLLPSRPLCPLDCTWRRHGLACSIDTLPVQRGECRSRPRLPCQGTGPLHQRHCHGRRNTLVSSSAAGSRPSFASCWGGGVDCALGGRWNLQWGQCRKSIDSKLEMPVDIKKAGKQQSTHRRDDA